MRLLSIAATLALVLSMVRPAHAQADPIARAATLAREAEKLQAEGNTAEACGKLDESLALDARGSTALELGLCREKQGKIGSAYRAYGRAAELSNKEKRADRASEATKKQKALQLKVPQILVSVPAASKVDGLSIEVGGVALSPSELDKGYPVDAGEIVVSASAPGREPWSTTTTGRSGQPQRVTVPALAVAKAAPPPAPPAPPSKTPPTEPPPAIELRPTEPADASTPPPHSSGRLVVELAALGGFGFADVGNDTLADGTAYNYASQAGLFVASCGDTTTIVGAGECEAFFDSAAGALVGGELLVGWAIHERVTVGARGIGAARFPEGFLLVGGPTVSVQVVGPLWLGATFLVGGHEHAATVSGARGSVPPPQQPFNGPEVDIPVADLSFTEQTLTRFVLGGSLEVGLEIVGPSDNAFAATGSPFWLLDGAVVAGLWPSLLAADGGLVLAVPAGVGYRFH